MTSPSPFAPFGEFTRTGHADPVRPEAAVTRVRRTALQVVRDVLICVACLCVAFLTGLSLYMALSVGRALSQVGNAVNPAPTVACSPTPDWPC